MTEPTEREVDVVVIGAGAVGENAADYAHRAGLSTVLVESTFNRTGIGAYMVTAVLQNDLYAVIGSILVVGVVFIVANLVVDLVQLWINPRLRSGMGGAPRARRRPTALVSTEVAP